MGGVKATIDALNVIYEQKEGRNVLKLNVVALLFTLAGFAILLAIAAIVVLPLILSPIGFGSMTETLTRIARWPVLLVVLLIGLDADSEFQAGHRSQMMNGDELRVVRVKPHFLTRCGQKWIPPLCNRKGAQVVTRGMRRSSTALSAVASNNVARR